MCGRITQYRNKAAYADAIGWNGKAFAARTGDPPPNWNVAPGTAPLLMHRFDTDDEQGEIECVHWGYRPSWAEDKSIPQAINARLEKAATGAFFRALWKSGRAIVPADGWYEWTGEPRHKQPWYIRLGTGQPMFLAAITNYRPGKEVRDGTGFVIVTASADSGLLDVHDRRPVVFTAEDALLWMDNSLPAEQAEQLARMVSLPADAFAWHKVSKDVNRAGTNAPRLIDAIGDE
jgi:putative SOS response-associated peptidase YedK